MREAGRIGGKAKSELKSEAARINGMKGGRPSVNSRLRRDKKGLQIDDCISFSFADDKDTGSRRIKGSAPSARKTSRLVSGKPSTKVTSKAAAKKAGAGKTKTRSAVKTSAKKR
jgi:hypothetical protein